MKILPTTPIDRLTISSQLLIMEAFKREIECEMFENDDGLVSMSKLGKQWYVRGSRTSTQSSIGKSISDHKYLAKELFVKHNVPTATYVLVKTIEDIHRVEKLSFPVVGKPSNGTHGMGVVVGLHTMKEVIEYATDQFTTWLKPNREGEYLLFEEIMSGNEYRVLCVDYKMVAVTQRVPAHVIGDGIHTVQQLIDKKNTAQQRGTRFAHLPIEVDHLVHHCLKEQGYDIESIPDNNMTVILRKTANLSTGGDAWSLMQQVHPTNIALFEKIAQVCDLNTIGIDVMCNTLEKPIDDQPNTGIIEVNCHPGLRMHHFPLRGEPVNAAGLILDMVERKLFQE